jgi:hypothetical protein
MPIQTDLSVSPYFNDFDQTKNYYQVLYRPATAVQVRELNAMQTMQQDQINKFGRSVYKEGSVIEGCSFTFDNRYSYVKINDTFANNSLISTISTLVGANVVGSYGLTGIVVNALPGLQSQAPNLNTLFVKYTNSVTYPNGSPQTAYSSTENLVLTSNSVSVGNVTVATSSDSTGYGYAFSTTEGVIFKKGYFLRVPPQTLVVSSYSNTPDNISVGFQADESIITQNIDSSLYDNAAGAPNQNAPGAYRLKIVPNLVAKTTSSANTSSFFSLADFKNGLPVTIKNNIQLVSIGKELARRTYETSGDYVVNPFTLSVANKSSTESYTYSNGTVLAVANSAFLNLISSPGIGYVKGYRVEFINNNTATIRRGTDIASIGSQNVTANFGHYVNVNQRVGDFGNDVLGQIELHSVAKTAITNRNFLNVGVNDATKIGTAYCRGAAYTSGTPGFDAIYRVYLFNIVMLPGFNFSQVRSIINKTSGLLGIADIILSVNSSNSSILEAQIQSPVTEIMIETFGQKALVANSAAFSNQQYVRRAKSTSSFGATTSGVLSINVPTLVGSAVETFVYTGNPLSTTLVNNYSVIPTANGTSATFSAQTIASSGATVTGTSTLFTTQWNVGDYILAGTGETRRIVSISNSTNMTVDSSFNTNLTANTFQKSYPAGVPLNFANYTNRTVAATSSSVTFTFAGSYEYPSSALSCSIFYDILRASSLSTAVTAITKSIKRSTLVKIQANTNIGGTTGPWCLGIPDVYRLNNVWVDSTGGTYATTNQNLTTQFFLDNGQRDAYYGLATISSSVPVAANATILVSIDNFTIDTSQGLGFFTAGSYPIDDANTANTNAIQTAQIPLYVSRNTGTTSDLRDSVDFRPYVANTASATATTTSSATLNPASTFVISSAFQQYLPTPDTNYQATIQHYLPRQDRIALTTSGDILITEGVAANNPVPPLEIPGTMTIGIASISAYPSLISPDAAAYGRYDYAVQMTIQQTKRYTMADIGKIDSRISRLEYYTSLSLTEQAASNLLVRSSVTGQNRFQNGILVDPFHDFTIGNTQNPAFKIAIDSNRSEARPYFSQVKVGMYYDSTASTNTVKTGDIVTLPFSSVVYQTQQFASKFRNCIEGNIYNYTGSLTLDPPGTVSPDITQAPDIISNLDLNANWANLTKFLGTAIGTSWANWTNIGSASSLSSSTTTQTGSTTNADGSITNNFQNQVTTTSTQNISRSGVNLVSTDATTGVNLGNVVTNVSILPYIKSTSVLFKSVGMKPNTLLYAYFNNVPVSNYCIPLTYYSNVSVSPATYTTVGPVMLSTDTQTPLYKDSAGNLYKYTLNNWGGALRADSTGTIYGVFWIPDAKFNAGQIEFKLTDISNLVTGASAYTTQATATYYANPISIQQSQLDLQVRSPVIQTQEVVQNNSVQQVSTTSVSYDQLIAAPPPVIPAISSSQYQDNRGPQGDSGAFGANGNGGVGPDVKGGGGGGGGGGGADQ